MAVRGGFTGVVTASGNSQTFQLHGGNGPLTITSAVLGFPAGTSPTLSVSLQLLVGGVFTTVKTLTTQSSAGVQSAVIQPGDLPGGDGSLTGVAQFVWTLGGTAGPKANVVLSAETNG